MQEDEEGGDGQGEVNASLKMLRNFSSSLWLQEEEGKSICNKPNYVCVSMFRTRRRKRHERRRQKEKGKDELGVPPL